jgi:hypothetical protein
MREAPRPLLGEHDFASFCRRPQSGGTVRRLERLSIARAGDRVEISARANAFLHQMVRALVGTLVAVGDGRLEPGSVREILEARDRSGTPQMAPAHGLTLERVIYGGVVPAVDLTRDRSAADHLDMEVLLPRTLEEALELVASNPGVVPIAGGTDVMVELNMDLGRPEILMDVSRLPELFEIRREIGQLFLAPA